MWAAAISLKLRPNKIGNKIDITSLFFFCSVQVCLLKENIISHPAYDVDAKPFLLFSVNDKN